MTWAPDYVTSDLLKSYLDIDDDDATDDPFVALWITTVSRNVDDFCGRQFGSVAAQARTYRTAGYDQGERAWLLPIDDLFDAETIVVERGGSVVAADGYELWPLNAPQLGRPYERLLVSSCGRYTVTAPWGWTSVPAAVSTGVLLQAARLEARRGSPFGVAGSPSEGNDARLLTAALDPDFRSSLRPLRRKWWVA